MRCRRRRSARRPATLARALYQQDDEGELKLGYCSELELRASKECEGARLLGVGDEDDGAGEGAVTEVGDVRSFSWKMGAIHEHYAAAVSLSRGAETAPPTGGDPSSALFS